MKGMGSQMEHEMETEMICGGTAGSTGIFLGFCLNHTGQLSLYINMYGYNIITIKPQ